MKELKQINIGQEVITKTRTGLSHEEMVTAYNEKTIINNFLGGVEVDASKLDNLIAVSVKPSIEGEDGEKIRYKWEEIYPTYTSLDGKKALIRFCSPVSITQWYNCSSEEFYKLATFFGIENVITKSEFQEKLTSTDYTEEEGSDE